MSLPRVTSAKGEIKEIRLPRAIKQTLPAKIDIKDLHANGKLYSDAEISILKSIVNTEGKHSKKSDLFKRSPELSVKYSVTSVVDPSGKKHLLAMYTGASKNKVIGKGSFGSVKYAQDLETGEWYAAKSIIQNKSGGRAPKDDQKAEAYGSVVINDVDEEALAQLVAEMKERNKDVISMEPMEFEVLAQLDQTIGQFVQPHSQSKDAPQKWMFMKLAPGVDLASYLEAHLEPDKKLSIKEALPLIQQMLLAYKDLHDLDILHRDIKTGNMIYDEKSNQITLIDYGLSTKLHGREEVTSLPVGTPGWVDPDIEDLLEYADKNPDEIAAMWQRKWNDWQVKTMDLIAKENNPALLAQYQHFIQEGKEIFNIEFTNKPVSGAKLASFEQRKEAWKLNGYALKQLNFSDSNEWGNINKFLERMEWSELKNKNAVTYSKASDTYSIGIAIKEILLCVKNEELKQFPQLISMYEQATAKDPKSRPTIDELLQQNKQIMDAARENKLHKVAVVDCKDLRPSLLNAQVMQKLKIYDEVILVRTDQFPLSQTIAIKNKLEQQGIKVSERSFITKHENVDQVIAKLRAAETSSSVIYLPTPEIRIKPTTITSKVDGIDLKAKSQVVANATTQLDNAKDKRQQVTTTISNTKNILDQLKEKRLQSKEKFQSRHQVKAAQVSSTPIPEAKPITQNIPANSSENYGIPDKAQAVEPESTRHHFRRS